MVELRVGAEPRAPNPERPNPEPRTPNPELTGIILKPACE